VTTTLHQILAVEKQTKSDVYAELTKLNREAGKTQKDGPLFGQERIWEARFEPESPLFEMLQDQKSTVQIRAADLLARASKILTRLFDLVATKDWANTEASATLTIGEGNEAVVIEDVPVTFLLFLEKQLTDLETFLRNLPTLDPAHTWTWDASARVWRSEVNFSARTKKVRKSHVLHPGSDRHAPQVEAYTDDEITGQWMVTQLSGAMEPAVVSALIERCQTALAAVRMAREAANNRPAEQVRVGRQIFDYILNI
jgi:hypothetical protein